jgi:predicted oxidoreductase (fatty acid repression mutant protein)
LSISSELESLLLLPHGLKGSFSVVRDKLDTLKNGHGTLLFFEDTEGERYRDTAGTR